MISKTQEKCLRIIDKTPLSISELATKLNLSEDQTRMIFSTKEMDSYITYTIFKDRIITTTEEGKAALQNITKDKWRFIIPTAISVIAIVISIIALVVSYNVSST